MKTATGAGVLHRLKDSDLRLADPQADIRGRRVVDREGEELGKVEALLIDEEERKVRFLEVASGGLLGIGRSKVLLPVEAVTRVGKDEVRTSQSRERVRSAPRYAPDLVERSYLSELYGHYGYRMPFWDGAYVYPRYPYL